MKVFALIADAIREIYSKKIIIGLIVIEVLVLGITAIALFSEGMQAEYSLASEQWSPDSARAAQALPPRPNYTTEDTTLLGITAEVDTTAVTNTATTSRSRALNPPRSTMAAVGGSGSDVPHALLEKVRGQLATLPVAITLGMLFLGLFATAGTVPAMMEKGTIELLLSKPISRGTLLLGRSLGGVVALGINHALFVAALWGLFGWASGVWLWSFLVAAIVVPLFTYIVVYSGVVFLSIITESWVLPLSIAYLHISILGAFLYAREATLFSWINGEAIHRMIDGLYWMLPQTNDLGVITSESIYGSSVESWAPVVQGVVFLVVMSGLALWRFSRKDF
jgi:ABC-type transport system involved in multi-copper enzyme maturation permease subunit